MINVNFRFVRAVAAGVMLMLGTLLADAAVYTWSRYDLTFEVPDRGWVTYNSSSVFEIRWDDMAISIRLFDKSGADSNFLKYNLQKNAAGYNMYDTKLEKAKLKGFDGYCLTGTMPDGSRARLTNVTSKKTKLAMQIEINYLSGNEKVVEDVLKSFAEGKKQKIKKQEEAPKQKIQKKGAKPKPIKPGTTDDVTPEKLYEI